MCTRLYIYIYIDIDIIHTYTYLEMKTQHETHLYLKNYDVPMVPVTIPFLQVTRPSFTEGWTERMWQFLGQAKTCGHEGVDDDHVPQFIEILEPNNGCFFGVGAW